MLSIRTVTPEDQEVVMPMVQTFYRSDAVDHDVPAPVLARAFRDAADPANPFLDGYLLLEDGQPVGYCYVANSYSAEVGGAVAMVEELYLLPQCRGKGYGAQTFQFLFDRYRDACRFRLEVTPANTNAARLYQRLGFRDLSYNQMILDRHTFS